MNLTATLLAASTVTDGLDAIVLPIIGIGADLSRPESVYLIDEALELW